MFDVYQLDEEADAPVKKYDRRGLRNLDKIDPKLPKQNGYVIGIVIQNSLFEINFFKKSLIGDNLFFKI